MVDEVRDEDGKFVGNFFEEEFGAHFQNILLSPFVELVDIAQQRVWDVLIDVVQAELFLVNLEQFYDRRTVNKFIFLQQLVLLLAELPLRPEYLRLLHPNCLPHLALLIKRIAPALHLHYRLNHQK